MSRQEHLQRLQRVLFLIKHGQIRTAEQSAFLFNCHPSTIKRLIARLKAEGHPIYYDKVLKKYVLQPECD